LGIAFLSEAEEGAFRRVARGAPPFPAPLRPAPLFEAGLPGQAGSSLPAHPPVEGPQRRAQGAVETQPWVGAGRAVYFGQI